MPRQRRNINRRNAALDGANLPAEPTDYNAMSTEALRLVLGEQALAIPPKDTPNYLSQLTPPTPIDINKFASYLQGHPDHTTVNHLLTGFFQGFKIGYSGPRAPKEYSNLPVQISTHLLLTKTC